MTRHEEFEDAILSAETAFAADGMDCPECGEGKMSSDGWPEELYGDAKMFRIEYFTCPECGWHLAVRDTYILDRSLREVRTGEDAWFGAE